MKTCISFNKIKRYTAYSLLIACLSLIACNSDTDSNNKPSASILKMDNFEITSSLKNSYEYEYKEFNLGNKRYTTAANRKMPYKLRGAIAVPNGAGPFPLVLVAHGAYEERSESKRFDTGFDYLVKGLAQNGYVAVSMDVVMPYILRYGGTDDYLEKLPVIVNEHIQSLKTANDGGTAYKIELTGKIDFEKTAIIGQQKSGSAVFQVAKEHNIKTVLSLAPSCDFWANFSNSDVSFLVPQYDGNAPELDGMFMYDYLSGKIEGKKSVTLLMGANHNFFNRSLKTDDSTFSEEINGHPALAREEQEEFLINYAVDFFDSSFGKEDNFYHMTKPHANKMYGKNVLRQISTDKPIKLIDPSTSENFETETGNTVVQQTVDSYSSEEDYTFIDTITTDIAKAILDGARSKKNESTEYVSLNRNLIGIEWKAKNSQVRVLPIVSDFSSKTNLTINLVPDSASNLNKTEDAITFSVVLRDNDGNVSKVTVADNQNIFSYSPGKMKKSDLTEEFIIEYWTPATPIGMLNIPLSSFESINLKSIKSVDLFFDGNESGSIFISSMQLQ